MKSRIQLHIRSFRIRIILFTLIVSIILIIISLLVFNTEKKIVRNGIYTELDNQTTIIAQETEKFFSFPEKTFFKLTDISNNVASISELILPFTVLLDVTENFEMIFFTDSNGIIREIWPDLPNYYGLDVSNQEYFRNAENAETDKLFWSNSFLSAQSGNPAIALSKKTKQGTLVMLYNLKSLSSFIHIDLKHENDFIAVLDRNGKIIAHSDYEMVIKNTNLNYLDSVREVLETGKSLKQLENIGNTGLINITPIKGINYFIVQFRDYETAFSALSSMTLFNIIITVFISLICLLIIFTMFRVLFRPVSKLTKEIQKISDGNYQTGVNSSFSEFDDLIDSFMQMVNKIKDREQKLRISVKEKEILLKELFHRTKNNMQVIISILNIQSLQLKDKKIVYILKETQNRIRSIALVHEMLYKYNNLNFIELSEYISDISSALRMAYGYYGKTIEINQDTENITLPIELAVPCGLLLNELITNSFKHALQKGKTCVITIHSRILTNNIIQIQYSDNGPGMPEDFNSRELSSLGFTIIPVIINEQLAGTFTLEPPPGFGITIQFPTARSSGDILAISPTPTS